MEQSHPSQSISNVKQSNFAELHALTALLSNVGQRFFDFFIAVAEQ
jgi:hypothetical protein